MLIHRGNIALPAGLARNNTNSGAATLNLATLAAGNFNTKLRIIAPGAGGNAWTIAAAGDSAPAAGASIAVNTGAKTIVVHFEDGVSTVGDVETAIANLAGANLVVAIDAPGTAATVLHAPGDEFTASHFTGGAAGAFVLPAAAKRLHLETSAADVGVEASIDDAAPSAFTTTAARARPLAANTPLVLDCTAGAVPVVAALSSGGATLRVWVESW